MPVEHEQHPPAAHPDRAPASSGRIADWGPRYTETPVDPYSPDAPPVAEPWNAVTASFFILIVGYWAWRLRGRHRHYPFLSCCLTVLLAGGVGGTLYHALRTSPVFFLLDVIPIMALGLAGSIYVAIRLSRRWWWAYTIGAILLYFAFRGIMFQYIPRGNTQWAINLSYASLALLVLMPIAILLIRLRFRYVRWIVAGLVSFVIAWFFRLVDREIGIYLPMGSHWLWHTFGAISTGFIIEFFYLLEGEKRAERLVRT